MIPHCIHYNIPCSWCECNQANWSFMCCSNSGRGIVPGVVASSYRFGFHIGTGGIRAVSMRERPEWV